MSFVEQTIKDMQDCESRVFAVHQGNGIDVIISTASEKAIRKVEQAISLAVGNNDGEPHNNLEREEDNAVRIKLSSPKHGLVDLLLIADNELLLSNYFTSIVNSKDIRKLGPIMIDTICQKGRVIKIKHATENVDEM